MANNTVLNPGALGDTIATLEVAGVKHELVINEYVDAGGNPVIVKPATPLPVTDAAALAALLSIAGEDFATQTTLAALLAKVIAAPSTEAKQDAMITLLTTIAAITQPLTDAQLRASAVPVSVSSLPAGLATSANQTTEIAGLASILAKIIAAPATEAKQDTQITAEQAILAKITADPATQTTLAAILAKIIAAPATEAKQDTGNTSLASILAKIIAAPATEAKQDTGNTSLASILSKIIAAPATEAKQDTQITSINALLTGIVLAAGAAIIGKVGIDQTTDGTTNKVRATATQKPSIGATVVLAVTALQSLASSATAGWKSVRTSNLATLATDYEIMVSLTTANTAPANDKAMEVYVIPWYTSDGGTTWFAASGGTATLPTSADAAYTIATPHNFRLLGVLNYTTTQMVVQDVFLLSNAFGARMPDGFSIFIKNFSGAALSTGCIVDITPLNDVLV